MKGILKVLAVIELVCGLIGSFIIAKASGAGNFRLSIKRSWGVTISTFISCLFVVVLTFVVLYAIVEILDNQEELLKRSASSAPVNSAHPLHIASQTDVSEWKCSKCGKMNADYVGTCGCGAGK